MLLNASLLALLLPARAALPATLPALALPPGSLTHEQLLTLRRLASINNDAELLRNVYHAMGAVIGGRRCAKAMAICVDRQARIDASIANARAARAAHSSWLTEQLEQIRVDLETARAAGNAAHLESMAILAEQFDVRLAAFLA